MDKERIKERILKLRAMVPEKGASKAEAMAALERANALMEKYGFTEDDLRSIDVDKDMSHFFYKYGIKTQHPVAKWVSKTLGQFCGVKTWYNVDNYSSNAFGMNDDIVMFEFLIQMIHETMNCEWKQWRKDNPLQEDESNHAQYWGFMLGMSETITNNMRTMIHEREQKQEATTGTDLISLKHQIILDAFEKHPISDALSLHKSNSRGTWIDGNAAIDGRIAGHKVNLNRPLEDK